MRLNIVNFEFLKLLGFINFYFCRALNEVQANYTDF